MVAITTAAISPLTAEFPETATAIALVLTLDAVQLTPNRTGTPRLTDTGFADEFGLPVMLGATVLLILVFIVARRLKTS